MKLIIKTGIGILVLVLTGIVAVWGRYEEIEDTDLGIDGALLGEIEEFRMPESIVVGIVEPPSNDFSVNFQNWYLGTAYYQITRYGTPAINFHYVISPEGELITNKNSLPERAIAVDGAELVNPIVVGLFVGDENGIRPKLRAKLEEILLNLANQNSIEAEKIYIKSLSFQETPSRSLVMKANDPYGTWRLDFEKIKEGIALNYAPSEKSYRVEIIGELKLPKDLIEVNEEFEASLKVKNTGENVIYAGSGGEFFMTLKQSNKDKQDKSRFYINELWVSQTQAKLMAEGEVLRPGEEKEYIFKGRAPLEVGKVSEIFELVDATGKKLSDTPLTIAIDLEKTSGKIIEILETETGYLRVRETADFVSKEVDRVSPGDRFFVLQSNSGFFQIDLGSDKKGWVYSKYVKSIQ